MSIAELWPEPDRRDGALVRCLVDVHTYEPPEVLSPMQVRVLGALSHGLEAVEAGDVLGITVQSVKTHAKLARRKLQAKNTTHACCEAVRQGLIR